MIVKALTLTQPWALFAVLGEKGVETRAMLFSHRGPVVIHAALMEKDPSWRFDKGHIFCRLLAKYEIDPSSLAHGAVIGDVSFVDGCKFSNAPYPSCLPTHWGASVGAHEAHLGDFTPGRSGILMANPRQLKSPILARGMNGLWNWDAPPDYNQLEFVTPRYTDAR